ncbi:MAG TPA: CpsB/CapC family capsule biosynthesis tyrosine phosphatase [Bryobacteraceae bacterium]|nr:CpsB/CapC family capsule biosynthesis tyrosine phosphatase [Bryobacteraceae bacterium]
MIDIHSHVLPGVDDGALSFTEALEMVRIAGAAGTTDLVATPHANFEYEYNPAVVRERLERLQSEAGPQVKLHSGCDFHLAPGNIADALRYPARYTVNGKRYLLVEFPEVLIAPATAHDFTRLIEAGMTPIITHPERNFLLHKRVADLEGWVAQGCLVQVTAQSLLGRFGRQARRFARMLVARGLAHFVASDAHDANDRTPRLDQAYRAVARRYGAACAERLFVINPRAVLAGDPLPAVLPAAARRRRRWYLPWAR